MKWVCITAFACLSGRLIWRHEAPHGNLALIQFMGERGYKKASYASMPVIPVKRVVGFYGGMYADDRPPLSVKFFEQFHHFVRVRSMK